jgi:hypothetical protein
MKAALSQTAFAGAVHLHGAKENRLLADLDSNAWPQTGRNKALRELRRALAVHLCGDQHLAVVLQHGIERFRDGPFGFTTPAIVNTIYGRWWWPAEEKPGAGNPVGGPLPWTGDYLDGFHNKITMHAYANPNFTSMQQARAMQRDNQRVDLGDGYGLIRFRKSTREITFECWPRFADASTGRGQFAGWPITIRMEDNDGRVVHGHLREVSFPDTTNPVVQIVEESSGDILYTRRIQGNRFRPPVYAPGKYTMKAGQDRPDQFTIGGLTSASPPSAPLVVQW